MNLRHAANVFAIAPGVPFLTTLVDAVLSGNLGFDAIDPNDPLALASTTIYVPTRRAARALRSLFAETSGSSSAILPTIRPLGDFDEDAGFFTATGPEAISLAPPISSDDRLLTLARLTQAWSKRLGGVIPSLMGDEPVMLPRTAADAIWLARDLANLMDEMEREGVSWEKLSTVNPDALSGWWQLTSEFLDIVTTTFPAFLQSKGLSDPVAHRNAMIRAEAERLKALPPAGPVIAAGSTGSIPATAELLTIIAHLPNGAVILPGLDRDMDDVSWNMIGDSDAAPSTFGHPQYGLKKLLGRFGMLRSDVKFRGLDKPQMLTREKLVSEAMRPAETTDLWGDKQRHIPASDLTLALAGISLIEAPTEREEALAIAIALREAIDEKREKTAALITTDRNLARRVCAELLRFGIVADDSGGAQLTNSPQVTLFLTMLKAVFEAEDAVVLLSLLKHPLALFGQEKANVIRAVETLELVALRGVIGRVTADTLHLMFEKSLAAGAASSRKPSWQDRVSGKDIEDARLLALTLNDAIKPLTELKQQTEPLTISDAIRASVSAFESIGDDENNGLKSLYAGDSGEAFADHLRGLLTVDPGFTFIPTDWPSIHAALIAGKMVKPKSGSDPNVFIWGSLEARLQEVDTLVLGGLNENTWPGRPADDPFLSRGMKSAMSLEPPERRIGQAAHDFLMGLGTERVILSRSTRLENAPSVASRWLQRLTAYIGDVETTALRRRGKQYLNWADALDKRENNDLEKRPEPSPPLELRPKYFSITDIEKLRRDPYSIYASKILKLKPLDPLIRDPDARERGNLFHEIMRRFIANNVPVQDGQGAASALRDIGEQAFAEEQLPADVYALWWPRFEELIAEVINNEQKRRTDIDISFTEISTERTPIGATGATISGRADRIDVRHDGTIDIIDYKTSSVPSATEASKLYNPQLALEGALAARGAFRDLEKPRITNQLLYYRLLSKGEVDLDKVPSKATKLTADELNEKAWSQLVKLVGSFNSPQATYVSHLLPAKDTDGDYDHLARVLEWSSGGDKEEVSDE